MLANILGISNDGPRVFEMKFFPTIEGLIYDEAITMHTRRENFI